MRFTCLTVLAAGFLFSCVASDPSSSDGSSGAVTDAKSGSGGSNGTGGSLSPATGGSGGTQLGLGGSLPSGGSLPAGGTAGSNAGGPAGGNSQGGVGGTRAGGVGGQAGNNTGGAKTGGQATGGGTSLGGSTTQPLSTTCTAVGPGANGSGSFTQYWFGQGTFKESDGYRTACGHFGKEPSGKSSDTVENIANPKYFAAIPSKSSSNFDSNKYCGACIQASGPSGTVVATVIDACPQDTNAPCKSNPNGHLDLSVPAMSLIGYNGTNLYPKNTTWKFVPCPVTGNVVVRIKPSNPDQIYIENTILPIQSVTLDGGEGKHLSYGAWQLPGSVTGKELVMTDSSGRKITVIPSSAPGTNQDTGVQFPKCN